MMCWHWRERVDWHSILAFLARRSRLGIAVFELQLRMHFLDVAWSSGVPDIFTTATTTRSTPHNFFQSTPFVLPTSPSFPSILAQAILHAPASALNALSAL